MILLLSPAKSQDFEIESPEESKKEPVFKNEIALLVKTMQAFSKKDLMKLMNISDSLADLNQKRYKNWAQAPTKPALFAFRGDVYRAFFDETFSKAELGYMEQHIRILSGLYGVLTPLTLIKPYRLEMGRKFAIKEKDATYTGVRSYWSERVTNFLQKELPETDVVINLASNEYSDVVDRKTLGRRVVDIVFKIEREGVVRIVPIFAKKQRGEMAKWMIKNAIEDVEDIKKYDNDGFFFDPRESSEDTYVFIRRSSLMR